MPQPAKGGQKQAQTKAQPVQPAKPKVVPQPVAAPTPPPVKKEEKPKAAPPKDEVKKEEDVPKQQPKPAAQQKKGKAALNAKGANKKLDTSKASDEAATKVVEKVAEPVKELGIAASVLGQDAVGQIGGANIIGSKGLF